MTLNVPPPVATYLAAEAAQDPEMLSLCFADDAWVHDEDHDYRGLGQIKSWKRDVQARYQYSLEPLDASVNAETVTLRCQVAGNFPGSPAEITYIFTLASDKIAALDIQ